MKPYTLLVLICVVLGACETDPIVVEIPRHPYEIPDSVRIIGPDSVVVGARVFFSLKEYGSVGSQYLYTWTVIDSPATFRLTSVRSYCEYIAADTGRKIVTASVSDLSTDSIVASTSKEFVVIRPQEVHPIIDSLFSVTFQFDAQLLMEKTTTTFDSGKTSEKVDSLFEKIALTYRGIASPERQKDTVKYSQHSDSYEYRFDGSITGSTNGLLQFVSSHRGDTIQYFHAEFRTSQEVMGQYGPKASNGTSYSISLGNVPVTSIRETSSERVYELVLADSVSLESLSLFDNKTYSVNGYYGHADFHMTSTIPVYPLRCKSAKLRITAEYQKSK